MSDILPARVRDPLYIPADCPHCKSPLEFKYPDPPPRSARVRCPVPTCARVFDPPRSAAQPTSSASAPTSKDGGGQPPPAKAKQRRMGTDARPLETRYYDCLGVDTQASADEVKKAYRRLAIKLHPDKNRDDPDAEDKFKEISIAYQTLMDPALRKKYNERGAGGQDGGGGQESFVDPEELFSTLFGGPKFESIIGTISIGRTMKESLQAADSADGEDGDGAGADPEVPRKELDPKTGKMVVPAHEKERVERLKREKRAKEAAEREERVGKLVQNLERRLSVFVEGVQGAGGGGGEDEERATEKLVGDSFKTMCALEAHDLVLESYGFELLQSIGATYRAQGSQYLASAASPFGGVLGWWNGAKQGASSFGETVGLVRSGLHLKSVFQKLQEAEKLGLTPEQMKALEEEAAVEGLKTLWKSAKMEVESVLRETCDRLLSDPAATPEKRRLRALGLELMGAAYLSAQKDSTDDEFVRVDTHASKAREAGAA